MLLTGCQDGHLACNYTHTFCSGKSIHLFISFIQRYGDGAGNTVEENSSVFSLIRMR